MQKWENKMETKKKKTAWLKTKNKHKTEKT